MTAPTSISKILSNQKLKQKILSMGGEGALEMILGSPTPTALVQSLPEEDFYWLIQDIGLENARHLLAMASNEQWRYIVDLQVWHRDRLHIDSLHAWFKHLFFADAERFFHWVLREEPEVLYLYLSKGIEVRIKEEDRVPSDFENSFFTLDGVLFVRILDEQHQEFLQNFLSRLARYNLELYQRILLNLGGVLPDALEEEGYRFRSIRLAEKGFLPFEEAIGVYQYLDPQALMGEEYEITKQRKSSLPAPSFMYLLPLLQEENLFAVCLKEIDSPEMLERLQSELAGLCNQILSADLQPFDGRRVVKQAVDKAGGYLTIGLEVLAKGDHRHAVKLLENHPLHLIFRVGYGRALVLKWRVEKWLQYAWFQTTGLDLFFWDQAWEGLLQGLLRKRPLFYTGLVEAAYREFQSLDDITRCETCLDQIEILDQLFHALLTKRLPGKENLQGDLTWKSLLLTLWARQELSLPLVMAPITLKALKTFFEHLRVTESDGFRIKEDLKTSFIKWLIHESKVEIDTLNRLAGTFEALFEEIESEYRAVRDDHLDMRFVRLFWLKSING